MQEQDGLRPEAFEQFSKVHAERWRRKMGAAPSLKRPTASVCTRRAF
jgi:hypothetical protein